jgi:hypothetical protein
MTRLLNTDPRLRRLCLTKPSEAAYPRSVLSRFIRKVGEEELTRIIEEKVVKLLKQTDAKDVDTVFDASFIKCREYARPTRQKERLFPHESQGWTSRQNLRNRLQTSIIYRFKD